jgi:hypothetical protein
MERHNYTQPVSLRSNPYSSHPSLAITLIFPHLFIPELYFLLAKFLENTPCEDTLRTFRKELEEKKVKIIQTLKDCSF